MDGDALCIVHSDFVNLQESWSFFLTCPACGSGDILVPTEAYPAFTCDSCGNDFDFTPADADDPREDEAE